MKMSQAQILQQKIQTHEFGLWHLRREINQVAHVEAYKLLHVEWFHVEENTLSIKMCM
jgi:hypothetical protein